MDPLLSSVLLTTVSTLLITPVEIGFRAEKAGLRECVGSAFFLYALIFLVGNAVAALLASVLLADALPRTLIFWFPFIWAFSGVFAFQGVISNANITLFGKGVLTIEEWIGKARDRAVAAALEAHTRNEQDAALKAAAVIRELPIDELNAHLLQEFGAAALADIERLAQQSGADPKYYKALELAKKHPAKAAALVRAARTP